MKKKIVALCLCIALVAIALVGASLAYFTDKDDAENVFTTGKVDITLNENFDEDNAKLVPGTSEKNAVTKEVKIALEPGSEDAWVWYEWLIPAALDNTTDASKNIIHVNSAGSTWDDWKDNPKYWADGQTTALDLDHTWDHDPDFNGDEGCIGTEIIDGIAYNKYIALYHGKLSRTEGGQTETTLAMKQVYMDEHVDTNENGEYTINGTKIDYDFSKGVKIYVRAYGMQAQGFDDVYAAYQAYVAAHPTTTQP